MLSPRAATILKSIVGQYIARGIPVPSQGIVDEHQLAVSSATIRNEMVRLEEEGYITRPHPSAGSIPLEKGYRYYVESLSGIALPSDEQILISHLFHQVERELEKWLRLAATLVARLVQNVALVTTPRPTHCQFKHLELVLLQDTVALLVAVFQGARVRQLLIAFDQAISQPMLTMMAHKLNTAYANLTRPQILARDIDRHPLEQQVKDCLLKIMQEEDEQEYDEPYLEGLLYVLNRPEFARSHQMLTLMELVEQRRLLQTVLASAPRGSGVRVVIGRENKAEEIQHCSVVISQYGLPEEAIGTIGVIGPTRMPYARAISTVSYISSVLTELVAELYGKENRAS